MPDFDLQLSAVVDGVNAHSWGDVSSRLTTLESLLKASGQGIDYFNVADNGLRPGKMRSHTSPLAGRFKVRNETGSGLSLGDLVYVSGKYSDGTDIYPTVAKAVSAISGSFLPAFGVVESAIANSANGTITLVQELTSVNTGGSSIGAPVYLSTTAGGWTLTRPTGDQLIQVVGYVVEVHASTGRILLSPATSVHRFQGTSFGQGLFLDSLAVRTSSPRSQVHIDAGANDIAIGTITESNFSINIEGDSDKEIGLGFTGSSSNSPTASIGAVRASTGGILVFRTSSSYSSNNLERLRIDKDGHLSIGGIAISVMGDGDVPKQLQLIGIGSTAYGLLKLATDQTVNGGTIGAITFGTTGATTAASNERRSAIIVSKRRSASNTTTPAGDLSFYTSVGSDGVAPAQRLTIDEKGNIIPGTGALATNATDGFLLITTSAGPPSGTPTAYTGRAQLHFDTTNNKIYVWNPTGTPAWKQTAALT